MQPRIIDWLKSNPQSKQIDLVISPPSQYEWILKQLETPLADLSISRPIQRLTWGVPVPNDSTQVVYVWLDALVNYLTVSGYPDLLHSHNNRHTHIVGKDIIK